LLTTPLRILSPVNYVSVKYFYNFFLLFESLFYCNSTLLLKPVAIKNFAKGSLVLRSLINFMKELVDDMALTLGSIAVRVFLTVPCKMGCSPAFNERCVV